MTEAILPKIECHCAPAWQRKRRIGASIPRASAASARSLSRSPTSGSRLIPLLVLGSPSVASRVALFFEHSPGVARSRCLSLAVPLNTCDPKEVTMVWVLLLSMAMPSGGRRSNRKVCLLFNRRRMHKGENYIRPSWDVPNAQDSGCTLRSRRKSPKHHYKITRHLGGRLDTAGRRP